MGTTPQPHPPCLSLSPTDSRAANIRRTPPDCARLPGDGLGDAIRSDRKNWMVRRSSTAAGLSGSGRLRSQAAARNDGDGKDDHGCGLKYSRIPKVAAAMLRVEGFPTETQVQACLRQFRRAAGHQECCIRREGIVRERERLCRVVAPNTVSPKQGTSSSTCLHCPRLS